MSNVIKFRNDTTVELVECSAADHNVVRAARVSTGMDSLDLGWERNNGLIRYLMKNRHGTPFEHNMFMWRIECPIFVAREFMRHRIASYNEESGRYKQLDGVFWVPAEDRPLIQEGKPGAYVMKLGTKEQYSAAVARIKNASRTAYNEYESMLEEGIAREVARACLTVGIYTSFYVTMNARSLMNFLSLRVDDPDAAYPSKPQYEIEQVARQMEEDFDIRMPLTYAAYIGVGRVCP